MSKLVLVELTCKDFDNHFVKLHHSDGTVGTAAMTEVEYRTALLKAKLELSDIDAAELSELVESARAEGYQEGHNDAMRDESW